jgi:hypothetical protein
VPALPTDIVVTELPDGGVRYVFPRRDLGGLRYVGLVPLAFGLFFAGFAVSWTAGVVQDLVAPGGGVGWFGILFALWGVPFIVAGLMMAGAGMLILAGHSEVQVRRGRLWAMECAGWLRWPRSRRVENIRRFKVTLKAPSDPEESPPEGQMASFLGGLGVILVECDKGTPLWLAPAYPLDWLRALADELARRCQTVTDTGEPTPAPAVQEEVVKVESGVVQQTVEDQPPGSRAVLEEHADGVTITLPPAGVWRGSKGLFMFSLLWNAIMAVITAMVVGIHIFADQPQGPDAGGALLFGLVITLFWAIGAATVLAAVNMGRRRAVLAVVRDRLLVLQTGLFGTKRREWERAEVRHVGVGPSGLSVNERPVLELQLRPREGAQVGLLAGRDEEELHWIATRLRRALNS